MATPLDMSLDDMIKKSNRGNGERFRGRGRARRGRGPDRSFSGGPGGRMAGPVRRGPLMVNARPTPYTIAKSFRRTKYFPWRHDLFEDSLRAAGISGIEIGTRLYVSNLDYGVTNEDIRELFAEIGDLKRYAVHYDKNGRPNGSAEVVYGRRSDAFAALKKYNNVLLDGKPMKIEIVGGSSEMPVSARVNVTGVNGRKKRTVVMTPGPGRTRGPAPALVNRNPGQSRGGRGGGGVGGRGGGGVGGRGGGGGVSGRGGGGGGGGVSGRGGGGVGGRGRGWGQGQGQGQGQGRGRGRGRKIPAGKDELDNDLDKYHSEAMNTS